MSFDPRDYDGENHERDEREELEAIWLREQEERDAKEALDAIDPDLSLAEVFGSAYIAQPVEEALARWRKSVKAGGKAAA